MKPLFAIALLLFFLSSCSDEAKAPSSKRSETTQEAVSTDLYELSQPRTDTKGVLVIFGGYPQNASDIEREFKIIEMAKRHGMAVVLLNFNQKLWLETGEKQGLAKDLQGIFSENDLPTQNITIGGYSSGGNIALLISDFLVEQASPIAPKRVFVVDSPIDLVALYQSSEKNVARNFSPPSVQESNWILETLGEHFGSPHENIALYEQFAVYTFATENMHNLANLKSTSLRLYTEPDTLWWKENKMADFDQMNAFYLLRLSELLQKKGFDDIQYIPTENKGYRANGDRHPHSWSIVDKQELLKWMQE